MKIQHHWINTQKSTNGFIDWRVEEVNNKDTGWKPEVKITCIGRPIQQPGPKGTQVLNHEILQEVEHKHGPRLKAGRIAQGSTYFQSPFPLHSATPDIASDYEPKKALPCLHHQDWWNHIQPEEIPILISEFKMVKGPADMEPGATLLLQGKISWEELLKLDPKASQKSAISAIFPEKVELEAPSKQRFPFEKTNWEEFPVKSILHTPEFLREIIPVWLQTTKTPAGKILDDDEISTDRLKEWLQEILHNELGAYPNPEDREAIKHQKDLIEAFNEIPLAVFTHVNLIPPITWFAQSPRKWQILTRSDHGKMIANYLRGNHNNQGWAHSSNSHQWEQNLRNAAKKHNLVQEAEKLRKTQPGSTVTNPLYREHLYQALQDFGGPNGKAGLASGFTDNQPKGESNFRFPEPTKEDILLLSAALNEMLPLDWTHNEKDLEFLCTYHTEQTPLAEAITLDRNFTMLFIEGAQSKFKKRKLFQDIHLELAKQI